MSPPDILEHSPDWNFQPLGECLHFVRNGLSRRPLRDPPGFPVSRIQTLTEDGINPAGVRYLPDLSPEERRKYLLDVGDVLMSHINSEPQLGRAVVYRGDPPSLVHGMNLLRLKVIESALVPDFLEFVFRWYRARGVFIRLAGRAVGQSSINQGRLRGLDVPVPSLSEQRAIANVLRIVQRSREQGEQVIAAVRALKRRLLDDALSGDMHYSRGEVEHQKTSFGIAPAEWPVRSLGEISTVKSGVGFPHRLQGKMKGLFPFYKVSDMNLAGNEIEMKSSNNYIDQSGVNELRTQPFAARTTIFPKVGGALFTNKKRILTRESLVDNNIMGVTPLHDEPVRPWFIFRCFELADLASFSNPGPLPSITASAIKEAQIAVPPLDVQDEILWAIDAIDQKLSAEEQRVDALRQLFKTLLHGLMTGKTRVGDLPGVA